MICCRGCDANLTCNLHCMAQFHVSYSCLCWQAIWVARCKTRNPTSINKACNLHCMTQFHVSVCSCSCQCCLAIWVARCNTRNLTSINRTCHGRQAKCLTLQHIMLLKFMYLLTCNLPHPRFNSTNKSDANHFKCNIQSEKKTLSLTDSTGVVKMLCLVLMCNLQTPEM